MSTVVIRSVPFLTRLRIGSGGARDLLVQDRARAQKHLDGLGKYGPLAHHESRHRRERHRHHHHGSGAAAQQGGGGSGTAGTGSGTGSGTAPTGSGTSIDVTDSGVTYTMSVGVGSPATQYTLLIDTGSSNTWVGAGQSYNPTSTSKDTGNTINVSYGSGTMSGEEYTDTVTLNPSLVIQNQGIGVASSAQGFSDVDGIIGIGPVDLTQGTVSNTQEVPTVTDNLYAQGTITSDSLGISYEPSSTTPVSNGEITFGGVDNTKYTGEINFVPLTTTSPASNYWGVDQSITYGTDGTTILDTTAGIVDTGTTLLMIASDAYQAYMQATGATEDQTTGLLTITQEQYNNLQSLYFNIGGVNYEFTANAQIWPRALNSTLGGNADAIYLIVSNLGTPSGQGLDFINGFGWLQRYYTVFDTGNSQLGFATTSYTDAETN